MRIGLLSSEYPAGRSNGGLCTYYCTLANALTEAGHEAVLLYKNGAALSPLSDKVRVRALVPCSGHGIRESLIHRVSPALSVARSYSRAALQAFQEEGVHLAQIPEYNGEAILFKKRPFPLVVRFHTPTYLVDALNGTPSNLGRKLWYRMEQQSIQLADGMTTSSLALQKEVCRHYRIPESRVRVIRNPVDTTLFAPCKERSTDSPLRVLYVGRLEKRKGAEALIRLFKSIIQGRGDVVLTVVGGLAGSEGERYQKELLEAAGPERHRLEFTGEKSRSELPSLYQGADLFVIPSLFDNSPNTLFEAQASGLPCVGADVGGVREMIDHGRDGLLYNTQVEGAFEEAVRLLLSDGAYRAQLGRAARDRVVQYHSLSRIAALTADYYAGLLS